MIGKISYEEVTKLQEILNINIQELKQILTNNNLQITDFISKVESYSKYLSTLIEINKDADEALKDLIGTNN